MQNFILYLFFFFFIQNTFSQEETSLISGKYEHTQFNDFVTSVEATTPLHFYYKKEWVDSSFVTASGTNLNIKQVLEEVFKSSDLKFYIDGSNIIIYKGKTLTEQLPEYRTVYIYNTDNNSEENLEITNVEKKYIESKKIAELELVTVGNKQKSIPNKNCVISGKIIDQTSGEPLIGATVYVKELGLGAATDLDGHFNLVLKAGKYSVIVNCMSMKEKKFYLQVYSDGNIPVSLEKGLISINEVTVVADKVDNVRGMQMGFERLSTKSIKEIPAVLGEKDLIKVAQLLPGVQSAGEGASGLNVRGGTADQNLFYINKIPVYNTSHLFGFFTAFNPDIVSDFSLYKSNIPANFGGRVASVFDISTRQGNKKEFFGQGGISPITGHVSVEGPIIKDKSSFVLSYRTTYSDWLLSQMNDVNLQNSHAAFYDIGAVLNTEINDKNILKFFFYRSKDKFSLSTSDDYDYANTGGSVSWKHFFSSSLNVDVSAVMSSYEFGHNYKDNPTEAYRQDYRLNHNEIKADFLLLTSKSHRLSFGSSAILYQLDKGNISPFDTASSRTPIDFGEEQGLEGALYISDEFAILPRLTLLAGLRYSFFALTGPQEVINYFPGSPINDKNIKDTSSFSSGQIVKSYSGLEPRVALNYNLGENNSVKLSYNRTQQYIFMLSNTIAISPTDQWKLADYHIKPPVSDQVSIGYYQDIPNIGLITSVEVYEKWTKNVVEYKDGVDFISQDPVEMSLLQGTQKSYGLEMMLKKNTGKLTGWISYCYSRSFVQVNNPISTEQINYGNEFPSSYDRPHSINFVSNLRANRRLSISTNVIYSTGRPITYPVASYNSEGQQVLYFSERNQYRIPDYFRVDLSVNIEGNLVSKKWIHSYWMLNVYNLTGRKNAYSVYYETKGNEMQGYKLSVFGQPIVTLSWNFKFGNYISE